METIFWYGGNERNRLPRRAWQYMIGYSLCSNNRRLFHEKIVHFYRLIHDCFSPKKPINIQ